MRMPLLHSAVTGWARRLGAAAGAWSADNCGSQAAAIAFYAAFSVAPMLVIVISIAGFFFGVEAVEGRLFGEIRVITGPDGAAVIQAMVASASKTGGSGWKTAVSALAIVVGASATFAQLHQTLNQVWRVATPASAAVSMVGSLLRLLRVRLMSFGLVLGVGFLLLVLLVLDAAMSVVIEWLWRGKSVLELAQQAAVIAMLTAAFAVLLRLLPDRRLCWRQVGGGALVAALLFTGGKSLFGLYLARSGTANAFGAAGSLAIVLMWLFYSAAVFLFGAEYAAVTARLESPARAAAEAPTDVRGLGARGRYQGM